MGLLMDGHRGFNQQQPLRTNKNMLLTAEQNRRHPCFASPFMSLIICTFLPVIPVFLWWTDLELGTLQDPLINFYSLSIVGKASTSPVSLLLGFFSVHIDLVREGKKKKTFIIYAELKTLSRTVTSGMCQDKLMMRERHLPPPANIVLWQANIVVNKWSMCSATFLSNVGKLCVALDENTNTWSLF